MSQLLTPVLRPSRILRLAAVLGIAMALGAALHTAVGSATNWPLVAKCTTFKPFPHPTTSACGQVYGPLKVVPGQPATYKYSFYLVDHNGTVKNMHVCFGGNFVHAKHGCLWQHTYKSLKEGARITRTLKGVLQFSSGHSNPYVQIKVSSPQSHLHYSGRQAVFRK